MKDAFSTGEEDSLNSKPTSDLRVKRLIWVGIVLAVAIILAKFTTQLTAPSVVQANSPPLPSVKVSNPLEMNLETRLQFLGQFSAIKRVELRAQVGGTLNRIGFRDGDIVNRGDLLFEIDPIPYEIKLSQATAQLESANARLTLASRELERANKLMNSEAGTAQNVDQRAAEEQSAKAAVDSAKAMIRDARFDLDHCRITAPFTGRIGTHLVSTGNLVAGNRGGSSTTLLATLVSLDPIYLDFDMSEADYLTFTRRRAKRDSPIADKVYISLGDEKHFSRKGTLDFIDNSLNRSSGTIRARATVPNADLLLTPGGFGSVRLVLSNEPTLLVPDAAVLPDLSDHVVLTIGPNDEVTPRKVQPGDLRGGLRVIRSGLEPADLVIVGGIETAAVGSRVSPQAGPIEFESEKD
ncbi:MAG: efflux RND transporter periplasmic adaptor subunit [Nitrospira sp.]|nr:efflux RND transporter periplasmic adaptor subunit [Nitrospira sp.]